MEDTIHLPNPESGSNGFEREWASLFAISAQVGVPVVALYGHFALPCCDTGRRL